MKPWHWTVIPYKPHLWSHGGQLYHIIHTIEAMADSYAIKATPLKPWRTVIPYNPHNWSHGVGQLYHISHIIEAMAFGQPYNIRQHWSHDLGQPYHIRQQWSHGFGQLYHIRHNKWQIQLTYLPRGFRFCRIISSRRSKHFSWTEVSLSITWGNKPNTQALKCKQNSFTDNRRGTYKISRAWSCYFSMSIVISLSIYEVRSSEKLVIIHNTQILALETQINIHISKNYSGGENVLKLSTWWWQCVNFWNYWLNDSSR